MTASGWRSLGIGLVLAGSVAAGPAAGFQVLTVGKVARFENTGDAPRNTAVVVVGKDRALRTLFDPSCPATSTVEAEAYLQSTFRDTVLASVPLDCTKWSAGGGGYRYRDPAGTVRAIRYRKGGLRIVLRGPGLTPIDDSEAAQQATIRNLERASRRDAKDGRSRFLLAMIHLYRFGQRVTRFNTVSDDAKAEVRTANQWFAAALPLLWNADKLTGDSRVPGFAVAARYVQGVVDGDETLRAAGLADLEASIQVNEFFNVFDFIPIIQAVAPGDPLFQSAFDTVTGYLAKPETLACPTSQPEICGNTGMAPHNLQGSIVLFGDIFAKAGQLAPAQTWYNLATLFPETQTWAFKPILDARRADPAGRVALYQDADPSNDPPVIGAGTAPSVTIADPPGLNVPPPG